MSRERVCVVGLWHLGTVTAACLASLGLDVVGVDTDAARVAALNEGNSPLFEPGLDELLRAGLGSGRLSFSSDVREAVGRCSCVWIAFDTPVDEKDEVDPEPLLNAARTARAVLSPSSLLIVSSQVPVGTTRRLAGLVEDGRPGLQLAVACIPENLRLGQAIERFLHPDMLVIGVREPGDAARVEGLLAGIETRRFVVSLETAEMAKHTINAYLGTCISFINEIANICELVGADALDVAAVLRADGRVSPAAPLLPGLGFAGATLARDVRVLEHWGASLGYWPRLLEAVLAVNEWQNRVAVRKLEKVFTSLNGALIAVFGLTYKPGTSTLRRSAALEMVKDLHAQGARIAAYDPRADLSAVGIDGVHVYSDPYEAAMGADALVLMTPWPEFQHLDFSRLRRGMRGAVLLDPQNFLDMRRLVDMGFTYIGMGRAPRDLDR